MSTPLATSSPPPRRSLRRPKLCAISTPAQGNMSGSETSSPIPSVQTTSPNLLPMTEANTKSPASRRRRKSQGSKKHNNGREASRRKSHAQTSSQTNLPSSDKKATPLKQAYAGPTFHSSPAASSLPMPSFYSKSLPTVSTSPPPTSTAQLDGQGHADSDTETLMPVHSEDPVPKGREPSPLDFMFDAARKARDSPRLQSRESRADCLSPFDDIPKTTSRTPGDISSESDFPFELDGSGGRSLSIGPFATSHKDRTEALRSPNATSDTHTQDLDERERKEKTEAFNRFLANGSPLRMPQGPEMNNYFHERAAETPSASPKQHYNRNQSGAPTPQTGIQHALLPRHYSKDMPAPVQEPPVQRPTSSHLRREYQPDNHQLLAMGDSIPETPPHIRTASWNNCHSVSGRTLNNLGVRSPHRETNSTIGTMSSQSAQKLEDDLRRVLKLDLTSST